MVSDNGNSWIGTFITGHIALLLVLGALSGELMLLVVLPVPFHGLVLFIQHRRIPMTPWFTFGLFIHFVSVIWTIIVYERLTTLIVGCMLAVLILAEMLILQLPPGLILIVGDIVDRPKTSTKIEPINVPPLPAKKYPWHHHGLKYGKDVQGECQICLEKFSATSIVAKTTNCMHDFHDECLRVWYETQEKDNNAPSCPSCRSDLRSSPIKLVSIEISEPASEEVDTTVKKTEFNDVARTLNLVLCLVILVLAIVYEEVTFIRFKEDVVQWFDSAEKLPCDDVGSASADSLVFLLGCHVNNTNIVHVPPILLPTRGLLVRRQSYICVSKGTFHPPTVLARLISFVFGFSPQA